MKRSLLERMMTSIKVSGMMWFACVFRFFIHGFYFYGFMHVLLI
jgi:hypothetical protein